MDRGWHASSRHPEEFCDLDGCFAPLVGPEPLGNRTIGKPDRLPVASPSIRDREDAEIGGRAKLIKCTHGRPFAVETGRKYCFRVSREGRNATGVPRATFGLLVVTSVWFMSIHQASLIDGRGGVSCIMRVGHAGRMTRRVRGRIASACDRGCSGRCLALSPPRRGWGSRREPGGYARLPDVRV